MFGAHVESSILSQDTWNIIAACVVGLASAYAYIFYGPDTW